MKKVFITFVFLATLSLSMIEYARAAEVIKIYPTDDAIAQLYDDDGFTDWNGARNYQGLVFREPFTSGITNNVGNIKTKNRKQFASRRKESSPLWFCLDYRSILIHLLLLLRYI